MYKRSNIISTLVSYQKCQSNLCGRVLSRLIAVILGSMDPKRNQIILYERMLSEIKQNYFYLTYPCQTEFWRQLLSFPCSNLVVNKSFMCTLHHEETFVLMSSFCILMRHSKKLNSVVSVRKRTIRTERPQPAGEVSANFSS
jgi:hypothetical protein